MNYPTAAGYGGLLFRNEVIFLLQRLLHLPAIATKCKFTGYYILC